MNRPQREDGESPFKVLEVSWSSASSLRIIKLKSVGRNKNSKLLQPSCPLASPVRSSALQEGAQSVVHCGQVEVLGVAALRLHPRLLVFILFASVLVLLLPPDGSSGAALQTRQDHVSQVLLQTLDVLPAEEQKQERPPAWSSDTTALVLLWYKSPMFIVND